MSEVFLSYSSKDRVIASHIQAALEAVGYNVFWDQEVPPGRDWNGWIGEKLAGARCVVVLWSKASVASRNVVHEATIAMERGLLVPALIEDLKAADFPMGFYTTQGADLRGYKGGPDREMARLIEAVGGRLGRKPLERGLASSAPSRSGSTMPLIAAAVAGVLLLGGAGVWFATRPHAETTAAEAQPTQTDAMNKPGGETVSEAAVRGIRNAVNESNASSSAVARALGHWKWDKITCAAGPFVTQEGARLTFTTPDSRFVHEVVAVQGSVIKTKVIEPAEFAGADYELTPLFFASSAARAWQLQVKEVGKDGPPDVWDPCEVE